jgi:hypothetical protein
MKYRTLFGNVDLFATKHRIAQRLDAALFRELQEQLQRLFGDAVL